MTNSIKDQTREPQRRYASNPSHQKKVKRNGSGKFAWGKPGDELKEAIEAGELDDVLSSSPEDALAGGLSKAIKTTRF